MPAWPETMGEEATCIFWIYAGNGGWKEGDEGTRASRCNLYGVAFPGLTV